MKKSRIDEIFGKDIKKLPPIYPLMFERKYIQSQDKYAESINHQTKRYKVIPFQKPISKLI